MAQKPATIEVTCPTCQGTGTYIQYIRKGRRKDDEHKGGPIVKVKKCPLCKGKKSIMVRY